MGNWSKLKADEKVRVIKFARQNGVSDIKTIRDTYNLYSSGGNLAHKYDGTSTATQELYIKRIPGQAIDTLGVTLEPIQLGDISIGEHNLPGQKVAVSNTGTIISTGYGKRSDPDSFQSTFVQNDIASAIERYKNNPTVLNQYFVIPSKHGTIHTGGVGKGQATAYRISGYTPPQPPPPPQPIDTFIPQPEPVPTPKPKPKSKPQPSIEIKGLDGILDLNLEKDNTNVYTRDVIQPIYMEGSAPVQNNQQVFDNVEDFMSYYGLANGGNLSHKKSTGGPLYPFSFEKSPLLKTPVVRYDEGGFFARLFGKKDTSPTPEEIKAERVERFINDTWETEYSIPRGYDPTTGLFYPYKSPEGGTRTIGPGFKLRKDGSGDNTMFSAKEAAKGVTREQINEKLRAQGELQYDKVLEFLNQKGNRLPVDTINPNIMNGLMDLRFQVGSLGGWDNLREAVLNGDLEGIKKESLVTFKDGNTGKIKPDVRRNDLRTEKFWHYD